MKPPTVYMYVMQSDTVSQPLFMDEGTVGVVVTASLKPGSLSAHVTFYMCVRKINGGREPGRF